MYGMNSTEDGDLGTQKIFKHTQNHTDVSAQRSHKKKLRNYMHKKPSMYMCTYVHVHNTNKLNTGKLRLLECHSSEMTNEGTLGYD